MAGEFLETELVQLALFRPALHSFAEFSRLVGYALGAPVAIGFYGGGNAVGIIGGANGATLSTRKTVARTVLAIALITYCIGSRATVGAGALTASIGGNEGTTWFTLLIAFFAVTGDG